MCDLRIASEDALMVMGYSGIGLTADGGSTYLLPRLIGHGRAMDLYLNNRVVDARQALEIGLVNQVTPADQLADTVGTTARRLAQGATVAFGEVKALMDQAYQAEEPAQLEAEARKLADMGLTEDFREGITAFLAKRPPKFQGR
jgi:2-(1,2-epoxy-1,2-dihydrophenyl)acetyl-CoA isomerase